MEENRFVIKLTKSYSLGPVCHIQNFLERNQSIGCCCSRSSSHWVSFKYCGINACFFDKRKNPTRNSCSCDWTMARVIISYLAFFVVFHASLLWKPNITPNSSLDTTMPRKNSKKPWTIPSGLVPFVGRVRVKATPFGKTLWWLRSRLVLEDTRFGQVIANNVASFHDNL